jgi:hypothetical protein
MCRAANRASADTGTFTRAIPESQRRAVDKVAEVLFADVRKIPAMLESETVN